MSKLHEENVHWSQRLWEVVNQVSCEHDYLNSGWGGYTSPCRQKGKKLKGNNRKSRIFAHSIGIEKDMPTSRKERDCVNRDAILDLLRTNIKLSKFHDNLEATNTKKLEATTTISHKSVEWQNRKKSKVGTLTRQQVLQKRKQGSRTQNKSRPDGKKKSSTAQTPHHSKSLRAQKLEYNNTASIKKDQPKIVSDNRKESKERDRRDNKYLQDCLPDIPFEHHEIHKEEALYRVMPISCEDTRPPPPICMKKQNDNSEIGAARLHKVRCPGFVTEEDHTTNALSTNEMSDMDKTDYIRTMMIDPNRLSESLEVLQNGSRNIMIGEKFQMLHDRGNEVDKVGNIGKTSKVCYKNSNDLNLSLTTCASFNKNENLALPVQPKDPDMPMENLTFAKSPSTHETFLQPKLSVNSGFEESSMSGPIDFNDMAIHHKVNLGRTTDISNDGQLIHDESINDRNSTISRRDDEHDIVTDMTLLMPKKYLSYNPQQEELKCYHESDDNNMEEDCGAIDKVSGIEDAHTPVSSKNASSYDERISISPNLSSSIESKDDRSENSTRETQHYSLGSDSENYAQYHPVAFKEPDKSIPHFKRMQELNCELEETVMVLMETETLMTKSQSKTIQRKTAIDPSTTLHCSKLRGGTKISLNRSSN